MDLFKGATSAHHQYLPITALYVYHRAVLGNPLRAGPGILFDIFSHSFPSVPTGAHGYPCEPVGSPTGARGFPWEPVGRLPARYFP